jgi:endonuclease YncB( thermonuclease family)
MSETIPCGGCGATKSAERCIGCLHDFGDEASAWVRKHISPAPYISDSPLFDKEGRRIATLQEWRGIGKPSASE